MEKQREIASLLLQFFLILLFCFIKQDYINYYYKTNFFLFSITFTSLLIIQLFFKKNTITITWLEIYSHSIIIILFVITIISFNNYTDLALIENFILAILLYFPIKNIIDISIKENKNEALSAVFLITLLSILIKSILYSTGNGINGDMYNSTYFSNYITLSIPLLNLIITKIKNKYFIFSAASLIIMIIVINLLNNARAATIAGILYIVLNNSLLDFQKNRFLKVILFIFIPVASCVLVSKLSSVKGRLSIWQSCLEIFITHPWGIGIGNLKENLTVFQSSQMINWVNKEKFLLADINDYAFNDYLQFIVEGGFLIIIALILFTILFWKKKSLRLYYIFILILSSTSYILHSFPTIIIIIVTLLILSYNKIEKGIRVKNQFGYIFLGIISVWSYFGFLSYTSKGYFGNSLLGTVINKYRSLDNKYKFDIGMLEFERKKYSIAIRTLKNTGLLNQDINVNLAIGYSFEQLNKLDSAKKYYVKANELLPRIFKPKYFLFNFYKKHNDTLNLKKICLEIINTPVKIKSVEIDSLQNIALIELRKIK
ncbi:O-antigen ligase family protein [Pedobacter rhodius]|uniref:O-antigen ligase family protein n=1 Tax=Pedobacter rhodius TaxID=3004098 RepID=A0ABT4KZ61_9SPHI|nr:O-antigen ligase family protein [Pedobacter sp. SJ11]MCZ4224225.1 O-antigen ligase family protein [Pedobacter sp. SJ11]